ncbi:hypothetical protein VTO42DRAFT_7813 [Malbranchea cinnamomea]
MRDPPPDVVASWPEPNYVNPEYQGPQLTVVGINLLVISHITVALRLWVRVHMKKKAGWDDWLMVTVMPIVIASTVCSIIGTHNGWGYHIWDNKPEWERKSRLLSWINQFLYLLIMTFVRVSILSSFLRFSTTVWLPRLSYTLIVINIAWGIAYIITLCLACRPLHNYWSSSNFADKCASEDARILSASIISIVNDILVFLLPLRTFWKLWLPPREKAVLIALMSVGLIACAASIIRTYFIWRTLLLTYDVTWDGYNTWLWTVVEVNLAVICASIPTLRPFARRYLPYLGFKNSSTRSRYEGGVSENRNSAITGMRMGQISRHKSGINHHQRPHHLVAQQETALSSTDALRAGDSRSIISNGGSANTWSGNTESAKTYSGNTFKGVVA